MHLLDEFYEGRISKHESPHELLHDVHFCLVVLNLVLYFLPHVIDLSSVVQLEFMGNVLN